MRKILYFIQLMILSITLYGIEKNEVKPQINNLRYRSSPNTDSEILGLLDKNSTYEILSKTFWKDDIDGLIGNWYEIRNQDIRGWAFGGYLDFNEDYNDDSVQKSFILPESNTHFENAIINSNITLENYNPPEAACGGERLMRFQETDSFIGYYDSGYSDIVILNPPNIPSKISITAISPNGIEFNKKYDLLDGKEYIGGVISKAAIVYKTPIQNIKLDKPVILIPFYSYPNFESGDWQIEVVDETNGDFHLSFLISIDSKGMYLSKDGLVNPFNEPENNHIFNSQEEIRIYGNTNVSKSIHRLLLYRVLTYYPLENGYYDIGPFIPQLVADVQTDNAGKFEAKLIIGNAQNDKGRYRLYYTWNNENVVCEYQSFMINQ